MVKEQRSLRVCFAAGVSTRTRTFEPYFLERKFIKMLPAMFLFIYKGHDHHLIRLNADH